MFGYIYAFFLYIIENSIKDIKHVDLYNNQYSNLETNDAIPYPSVLVNIVPQTDFKQHSSRLQSAVINVELFLATEFISSLRKGSSNIGKAVEHLSLVDRLFITFDGLTNNDLPAELKSDKFEIGRIRRLNAELLNDYTSIKVTKTTFTFNFADASAFIKLDDAILTDIVTTASYSNL